jgi:hypothetical protein
MDNKETLPTLVTQTKTKKKPDEDKAKQKKTQHNTEK